MSPAEQRVGLLRRIYERLGGEKIPPQPSKRIVRELVDRRIRAAPLSVGEQVSVMLLLCDHTDGDIEHWTARFLDARTQETARVAIFKALTFISQISPRPLRIEAKSELLEALIEPRILFDAVHQFGSPAFPDQVAGVLLQLSGHELDTYWSQSERCRRRAMIPAALLWITMFLHPRLAPLIPRSLEVMLAEPSRVNEILFASLRRDAQTDIMQRALAKLAAEGAAVSGPPRGLERVKVRAFSLRNDDGWHQVTYAIQHPEEVWLCGYFDLGPDGLIEDDHVQMSPLPPLYAPTHTEGYEVVELDAPALHRVCTEACMTTAAEETPGYSVLSILGMLEGTIPPDRAVDPLRVVS
jgi:hypothetical protein